MYQKAVFFTLVGLCLFLVDNLFGADLLNSDLSYYSYKIGQWDWFGVPHMIQDWIS